MPKELTHWHIAREALRRGALTPVGEIITSHQAVYYIGAVAHDMGFYDLSKPAKNGLEHAANQLHGVNGENTLVPLIVLMEKALKLDDHHTYLAFLLGMLTHYVADSTFHPMVYYMSGNYFAEDLEDREKAVFRHRLLETAIDLWLESVDPLEYPTDLIHLWREAGDSGRQTLELLAEHYAHLGDKPITAKFNKAWRNHRVLQTAFGWPIPRNIFALYRRLGHPWVEKYEALFYSQPLNLSFFDSRFDWQHPVTGVPQQISLKELYDESVAKVITLFERLNTQSPEKWPLLLDGLQPMSLDSGLPYVPVSEMKYFRPEPIELSLMVR